MWFAVLTLSAGVFLGTISARHAQLIATAGESHTALTSLGLTERDLALLIMSFDGMVFCAYALIAAIIFWRRSEDLAAFFVSLTLINVGTMIPRPADAVSRADSWLHFPIILVYALGTVSIIVFFYVFPDGRFVPRWSTWLALLWAVAVAAWYFWPILHTGSLPWPPEMFSYLIVVVGLGVGLVAQVYRYRRVSSPTERQQTKWILFGLGLAIFGVTSFLIVAPILMAGIDEPGLTRVLYIMIGVPFFYLTTMLMPVSIGLSILRYRLWNIDTLINRALVYGLLTGLLLAVYFGGVVMLQAAFRALAGQGSQFAIIISTLASAALAQPLRERVQEFIDRRFYRHKYDAELALAAFNARVRNEVDLNSISDDLVGFVRDTVQPSTVTLWLRDGTPDSPRWSRRGSEPRSQGSLGGRRG